MDVVIHCEKLGKTYEEGDLRTPVFDRLELSVKAGQKMVVSCHHT